MTRCNLFKLNVLLTADMAPRKRTTKQRKNDPKTAKLEAFLQDFDSEGEKTYFHEYTLNFVNRGYIRLIYCSMTSGGLKLYNMDW